MIEYEYESPDDDAKRESSDDAKREIGGRGKRRAVLLEGQNDVWTIHHYDHEVQEALDEEAAKQANIVAIHPITQERLTHQNVVSFVEARFELLYRTDNTLTIEWFVKKLNQAGGKSDQAVVNLLFKDDIDEDL